MSRQRVWLRAFRQGNASIGKRVAAFLQNEFDWDVTYSHDYECITTIHNSYGTWEEDFDDIDDMDSNDLLESLVGALNMGSNRIAKLDTKFNVKIESVGKYTKLPLPKDVKKEVANGNAV